MYGGTPDNKTYALYGKTDSAEDCLAAAKSTGHNIFTWHDTTTGAYANQCWFRLDDVWDPVSFVRWGVVSN